MRRASYQVIRQEDPEKAIYTVPLAAGKSQPRASQRWHDRGAVKVAGGLALLSFLLLLCYRVPAIRGYATVSDEQRKHDCHAAGQRHEAVTTLLFGERYVPAILTLGHTVKKHAKIGECRRQVALSLGDPASNGYSEEQLRLIGLAGWEIRQMPYIQDPPGIPERYKGVMSKLNIWNLTEYDAVMLLDGDTTIVGELDSAFESFNQSGLELGGVRDVQQRFINAGLILAKPDSKTMETLIVAMQDTTKYDMEWPEQAFLSMHYENRWHELPLGFNMYFFYHWLGEWFAGLFNDARANASVIHFAGEVKPWTLCPPWFFGSVCTYPSDPPGQLGTPTDPDLKLWASEFRDFASQVNLQVDHLAKGREDYKAQFDLQALLDGRW